MWAQLDEARKSSVREMKRYHISVSQKIVSKFPIFCALNTCEFLICSAFSLSLPLFLALSFFGRVQNSTNRARMNANVNANVACHYGNWPKSVCLLALRQSPAPISNLRPLFPSICLLCVPLISPFCLCSKSGGASIDLIDLWA